MIAPTHRLALLLVTSSLVLLAAAALPFRSPPPVPMPESQAPAPRATLPPGPAPLARYDALAARPLFAPDRRPLAAPVAAPETVSFRLEGVITTREHKEAILVRMPDGARLRLREGESAGEWTLRRIEPDRVVLASPEREITLVPGR